MASTESNIRNSYVQPITNSNSEASEINYDLDLEEQYYENVEYSKDMLLQDVSWVTRQHFNSTNVLLPPKNCKRVLYAWIAVFFVGIAGIGQMISFT